ncbi:hypothetical protein [Staphylococcus hominis]|uniref:hypothetical protein n=1 Tax=Staphylococcus hominis TaxID=1290 RepID=UPI0034D6E5BB
MNSIYHVQLKEFELQAINFMKKKDTKEKIDFSEPEYHPKIDGLVPKKEGASKEGILVVDITNDVYDLKLIVMGLFENINDENIDNETLVNIMTPLMLPLIRPIVYNILIQSGIRSDLIPTLDVKRHLNFND